MNFPRSGHWLVLVALVFVAATLALPSRSAVAAAAITVDSSLDTNASDNVVTLREAILLANGGTSGDGSITGLGRALDAGEADNVSGSPGNLSADTITFDPGVATILLANNLPPITEGSETIDGSTTAEIIQGDEARLFSCLIVLSAGNTIKGLSLTDCLHAVELSGIDSDSNTIGPGNHIFDNTNAVAVNHVSATGNHIIGNKIGTDAAGSTVPAGFPNENGVLILGAGNTVGGVTTADRNLISGNLAGVYMLGPDATGNEVYGNFIGTDVNGTVDLGNAVGVFLQGAISNTVGGTLPGQANVISGNSTNVQLNFSANTNTIQGNLVGPDINGGGLLISANGVFLNGVSDNTIGPGNVISDNVGSGVRLVGEGTSGNVVKGNLIGTNPAGTAGLPNGGDGVLIDQSAGPNTIGGTNPDNGNVIAFNGSDGIEVNGVATIGNSIRDNSIHDNGGLGINNVAGGNGEPNDPPPPVISNVGSASGTVSNCANCIIDVFSDNSTEGGTWHGSVIADGAGVWKYFGPVSGPNVTATATNPASGNTSEFSAPSACGDTDADTVNNCDDDDDDNDGFDDDAESGIAACKNGVNDDATDAETIYFVNDGCPAIGITEVNCGADLDNDLDGYPNDGCPKDGSFSEADFRIGTGSQDPCGNDGWPADLQANNKLDIGDINSFLFPLRDLNGNTVPGEPGPPPGGDDDGFGVFNKIFHPVPDSNDPNIARWNLQVNGDIDIGDLNALNPAVIAPTSRPPMFGGQPAFFTDVGNGVGVCPFPP